jgi:putative transposase
MLCEDQSGFNALPPTESTVGIDVGITSLVTLSAGEKITNPRHEQRDRERLARAQRILSRKQIESENRDKARIKVARVHARIVDRCGVIRADLPLEVREWTCVCGMVHDRDVNAARNILAAGLAVAACGDGVRPQRSTPGRRSSAKQEMVPPRRARAAAQP